MKFPLALILGAMLLATTTQARQEPAVQSPDSLPEIKTSRAAVQQFGAALKETLQQAMQNGGPVNGIAVCHDQAAQIAADESQKLGILIGRTSLKVRNPANAPDNWEMAVLRQFEARKTAGESVEKLEFFAVIDDDQGQKTFRYMKAIPTAALCLNCHGETLSPEVAAQLKERYPNDQGYGFKEGDLRGAFTIAKPLP